MMFLFGEVDSVDYSALRPANLTTLLHLSVSSAMTFVKSAGVPGMPSPPRSAKRALNFWSVNPALIALLSLATISAGEAFERRRLVARQDIANRRQIRQRRRTGRRSHRQPANFSGLDERQRRRGQVEHHLNLPAHQIDQRRRVAAVRHVYQID